MKREGDPLELEGMLGEDETVLTAHMGRKSVGVARLSSPFGSDHCHLSISDAYVLEGHRGLGVYGALLLAALQTPEAAWTMECGGPVYMMPINGGWQGRHAMRLGFRNVRAEDFRRWPFLEDAAGGQHPVMVYDPGGERPTKNRRTSKRTSRRSR